MKGYPLVPGVIDAGHDAANGWHPGTKADCPECKLLPPPRPPSLPSPPSPPPVKPTSKRHRPNEGSDCKTGKCQYVTRRAAQAAATALRHQQGRPTIHPFKCGWCGLFHNGNADRSQASKSRGRRK